MEKSIGDDKVILQLAGLRFIKKENYTTNVRGDERYWLKWNYKGADNSVEYADYEARDTMYEKVRAALTSPGKV